MEENERIVATVKEPVGDEVGVAGDAYMGWSVQYAKQMVERLEPYDMAWIEEPVIPDDIDGYAAVRGAAPMPIAGGEHEFTRWGHKELLERDAVDILQPDIHRCGGLTELLRIDAMASARDVPVIPHTGTNPHLHFIAASTNSPMAEYFPVPTWFKERQSGPDETTYADAIYADPPQTDDGTIPLPSGNGLSAALNREAIEHFAVE